MPLSEPANSVQIHLFPYPRLPSGATDTVEGDAAASECAAAGECAAADTLTPADLQEQETQQQVRNAALHACIFASVVSKKASEVAFAEKGRSMTAPDVIEKIGAAFQIIHPQG